VEPHHDSGVHSVGTQIPSVKLLGKLYSNDTRLVEKLCPRQTLPCNASLPPKSKWFFAKNFVLASSHSNLSVVLLCWFTARRRPLHLGSSTLLSPYLQLLFIPQNSSKNGRCQCIFVFFLKIFLWNSKKTFKIFWA
jgi:hypothetical protein